MQTEKDAGQAQKQNKEINLKKKENDVQSTPVILKSKGPSETL